MKDIEQLRRQLIERYKQLSALDQVIVRLFSLIYEPIARSTFLDCLNQAHYRDENNRRFNGQTLKSHLDILLEAEVITQDKGYGPRCHPLLVEIASRDSVSKGEFKRFAEIIKAKLAQPRTRWDESLVFQGQEQLIREIRLAIYRQDFDSIEQQIADYQKTSYSSSKTSLEDLLILIYDNPFDGDWLRTQPTKFQALALNSILVKAFEKITRADGAFSLLEELCQDQTSVSEAHLWLEQAIIRGQYDKVRRYLDRPFPESQAAEIGAIRGWIAFLGGENSKAIQEYTFALKALKKAKGKQKIYFSSISGFSFIFALLKEGTPERLAEAASYTNWVTRQNDHPFSPIYARLEKIIAARQGDMQAKDAIIDATINPYQMGQGLETLICSICLYWMSSGIGFGTLNAADQYWLPSLSPLFSSVAVIIGVGLLAWFLRKN